MSGPGAAHILAVHPPVASPALEPLPISDQRTATLPRMPPVELYDANIDFYVEYLLKPEFLRQALAAVAARDDRGDYHPADPATQHQIADLTTSRPRWEKRIAAADKILAICRSQEFYDPPSGVQALADLKALLRLISLAYFPVRIGWGAFEHPQSHDPKWLAAFPQDTVSNPFTAFYESRLAAKLRQSGLGLLLVWVVSRDQLPAVATLADFAHTTQPGLPVAVVGSADMVADCRPFIDPCLSVSDDQLVKRLQQLVPALEDPKALRSATGRSGEGPAQYLAPAKITAVDLRPDHFSLGRLEGHTAGNADCRKGRGDRGFIIRMPSNVAQARDGFASLAADQAGDLVLAVRTELRDECRAMDSSTLYQAGVKLVIWQALQGSAKVLKTILWDFSRAGIWNHLVLPAQANYHLAGTLGSFAAANPNIVHSWEVARPTGPAAGSPPTWSATSVYSRVVKLPGRPLWSFLRDPAYVLLFLRKHGIQKVMRWRVPDDSTNVYMLGNRLTYHYQAPDQLPTGYLDEICQMVADGGSVNMKRVRYNLKRAFLIAYAIEHGVIVGNSSLKNPRPEYIETVKQQSGLDLTHYVERGYTSVRPEYRGMGIGARLLGGLTSRAGHRKVFSVISEDNEGARKMALRNRTRQVAEYYSPRLGKQVGIWIPEQMLNENQL